MSCVVKYVCIYIYEIIKGKQVSYNINHPTKCYILQHFIFASISFFLKNAVWGQLIDFATQYYIINQCRGENKDKILSPRKWKKCKRRRKGNGEERGERKIWLHLIEKGSPSTVEIDMAKEEKNNRVEIEEKLWKIVKCLSLVFEKFNLKCFPPRYMKTTQTDNHSHSSGT